MTPTDRLLSIVLALQAKRWQRAEDLAELMGVSVRTIYRDMQALEASGVPVVAVPGKGYRLVEGYVLPPLMFTRDEVTVLLLGSDHMAQHFDTRYEAAAHTAARKLRAILPEEAGDEVVSLQESIGFVPVNAFDNPAEQATLQLLRRAFSEQRSVAFHYAGRAHRGRDGADGRASEGRPERLDVDPYGLLHQGGAWYLVGLCHQHGQVQHFRLTRMDGLALREGTFDRPSGYRFRGADDDAPRGLTVRVLFDDTAARWLRETPTFYLVDLEDRPEGAGLVATLRVRREAEVLPWLLGWGAHARVLEPTSLRHRVAAEAERMVAQYRDELTLL